MSTEITRNDNTTTVRTAGAIGVGVAAMQLTKRALKPVLNFPCKKIDSFNETASNNEIIRSQKENLLKVSGLDGKVKIIDFAERKKDFGKIQSGLIDRLKHVLKNKNYTLKQKAKSSFNFVLRIGFLDSQFTASKGLNAYASRNKVLINTGKLGLALPHELGHCKNYRSKFWRAIRGNAPRLKALAAVIALTGICTRKKSDGEKPDGAVDTVTTFVKNNTGTLTAAMYFPEIADELKASYNGNKYAKQVFSADIAKKIAKQNKYSALSYIVLAAAAGIAAWAGSEARDIVA